MSLPLLNPFEAERKRIAELEASCEILFLMAEGGYYREVFEIEGVPHRVSSDTQAGSVEILVERKDSTFDHWRTVVETRCRPIYTSETIEDLKKDAAHLLSVGDDEEDDGIMGVKA